MTEEKSAGTENPEFTLKGTINWEIKFTKEGLFLEYNPKSDNTNLVSLLISGDAATFAKQRLNEFITQTKDPGKYYVDRLNWAGKTAKGCEILAQSYIEVVLHDNANKKEQNQPAEREETQVITLQNIPTQE